MNQHIQSLIDFDIRHSMFQRACRFVDYEMVEGDIVEFGVYSGRSAALLSHYHEAFKQTVHGQKNTPVRKVIGLDSFEGMPANDHPRYGTGTFRTNETWHPVFQKGEEITPDKVKLFFKKCELPEPLLLKGMYSASEVKDPFNLVCKQISIAHIDCDLYESTLEALELCKDKFVDGSILLFDDWFNYKGSGFKGEQKAFYKFKSTIETENYGTGNGIHFRQYHPYATFGMSFIVSKS